VGVDDLAHISRTQTVLSAVLLKPLGGIDHKDARPASRFLLIDNDDASRNASSVEQVGWQSNDRLNQATPDQLFTDRGLGVATKEHSVGKNHRSPTVRLERLHHVKQECVVTVLLRRFSETVEPSVLFVETVLPGLHGERRVGDEVVKGLELLSLEELWIRERVSLADVMRLVAVQDHSHSRQSPGGVILLLAIDRQAVGRRVRHLDQQ